MNAFGEGAFLKFYTLVLLPYDNQSSTWNLCFLKNLEEDYAKIIPVKFGQNWPGRLGEYVLRICLHIHTYAHACLYRYLFEDLDF